MEALIRRIMLTGCCTLIAAACSSMDSERLYGPPYYEADDWYYGETFYSYSGEDISLPDRPDRPVHPEHPIALPPKGDPPSASQLPSGIDKPGVRPTPMPAASRPTPSFSASRPSIPSMPRAMPRGGGGGRRR